jgi:hypothetical protein
MYNKYIERRAGRFESSKGVEIMTFEIGMQVYSKAPGESRFYGTVTAIDGDRVTVKYDDFKMVRTVPSRHLHRDATCIP